jgi:four helix bundle protein
MKSRTFQDVEVWRKAHAWVFKYLLLFSAVPVRRTVWTYVSNAPRRVSVPANFAEGFKKLGLADKVRFYNIAQGSL